MKGLLNVLGFVLILQGVGGLINTLLGWWRWAHDRLIVNRLAFLEGHEIFASIVIAVLGLVMIAAADSAKSGRTSR